MPSIAENRPTTEVSTSQRAPFAAVMLRVPDLNQRAAPAAEYTSNTAGIWKFRDRLPSASSFLKGLTSRVLLVAIAMSAIAIFYMALNGTSPPAKTNAPSTGNIPLISALPAASNKAPTATVLHSEAKPNNSGMFQDLPRPSPTQTPAASPAHPSEPAGTAPGTQPSNVQPIRSIPAANPGPVLTSPNGDQTAMRPAKVNDTAHSEVFSWGQAEFNGSINKPPLGTASAPARSPLK